MRDGAPFRRSWTGRESAVNIPGNSTNHRFSPNTVHRELSRTHIPEAAFRMKKHLVRKRLVRGLALLLICFLALVVWGFIFAWRPLSPFIPATVVKPQVAILTDKQYELGHENPYLVHATTASEVGSVFIFGAVHTIDPNDVSLKRIRTEFTTFKPTVVLCEGRMTGLLFPGLMDPVKTFGEPGLVRQLAYRNGCEVYTWEPPEAVTVQGLLDQSFSVHQVAIRLILSSYFSNLRFGKPDDPDSVVLETLRKKKTWPHIGGVFSDVGDIDKAWNDFFPDGPDWRDVSDEYALPGFLGDMDANLVRDQHLLNIVCELTGKGERVFVIAGSSHAVKLESAVMSTVR